MNTTLTTPERPDLLVGTWVRLCRGRNAPAHLGVLARADPDPKHPGLWQWALRSPAGPMAGGPHLPVEPLTRDHTVDVRRARRQLADRTAWLIRALEAGEHPAVRASLDRTRVDATLLDHQLDRA